MGKNKSKKPIDPEKMDWDLPELSEGLGLFPEDIPFGRNIGCGGKSTKKPNQNTDNQKNKR
ncbi:MAG: hypothetical protein HWE15_13070 [Algoriphagus sp.]|uniref:hypothetical protein n=1 Tax=Algoriphagus sp. TaxID=1872435 RepID=UPI00184C6199|nr:hypothetical protein [Algoriphagus sp.]NVJ87236.1 hypothetical protein [Algoriphagus sp.]